MNDLQKALGLLQDTLGGFDNIKFLLGAGEDMTRDTVGREFLSIAERIASGTLTPCDGPSEKALDNAIVGF